MALRVAPQEHGNPYKGVIVLDGEEWLQQDPLRIAEFDAMPLKLNGMTFSPNEERFAFVKSRGDYGTGKYTVVVDGEESPEYDEIFFGGPVSSPDSKHVAYGAEKGDKMVVALDGQEGPELDKLPDWLGLPYSSVMVCQEPLVFSPDSTQLAYLAKNRD